MSSILQMLGLAEGDVDMIRNFGTVIDDDAVRSLVLSTSFGRRPIWGSCVFWYHELIRSQTRRLALTGSQSTTPSSSSSPA